ncbi:cation transport protein ChaC [Bradyrhizobium yuanmingense]|uniref:glutathione-specific gamma-glutamylcyclotransferase n=1 Tax=Bradyrhizobium yuanmingense TaxID=108015 RepID=A0A1C3V2W8_9BRAD|nr:gamma-glutamylcyclotransferase [Bradyrhizobium yuanmingense]TWI26582.1 cation transport protein ChaC [Bradyrhizobium yuanmingense]SCB21917.1 cation transport protein ChaC [Bradyrhizobium yuanmingense]
MIWIFGFGSLTFDGWQSEFGCLSLQRATLHGYRRAFNKKSVVNWGTEKNPGVTLNLKRASGERCEGVAFEFSGDERTSMALLSYLRKREACTPTSLRVELADGRAVQALTYIYNGRNLFDRSKSVAELAALVVKASGTSGSAIDYVKRNFEGLRAAGLEDAAVTELWEALLADKQG